MSYRLKKNAPDIDIVDGKFAGKKFKAGGIYETIPEEEKGKFEKVTEEKINTPAPPESGGEQKEKGGKK